MRRICRLVAGGQVPAHYIGSINRDELLLVGCYVLEPVEGFPTHELAEARASDLQRVTGVVHHVILNADM